jgi:hypothetical protein
LGKVKDCPDDQGNQNPYNDRPSEKDGMLPPIRFAHSRQKVIAVFFRILWLKQPKHASSLYTENLHPAAIQQS